MIRVMIADDHSLVRHSVKTLLKKTGDIEVIGEAQDGQEVLKLVEHLKPDVLVMDVVMPNLNGIQATKQVRDLDTKTKVVIISNHRDEILVQQALRYGAKGYVLKDSVGKELPLAVRAAHEGETYFSSSLDDITAPYLAHQP